LIVVCGAGAPVHAGDPCPECGPFSVAELRGGRGLIAVGKVAMSVNTAPERPEDDRVMVTGFIEQGSDPPRPGLRFEVTEDALALDACNGRELYSFSSLVFAGSRNNPIKVVDATLSIDYSGVHSGSGADFVGTFVHGFIMDAPFFSGDDIGVDFFTPAAARDNPLDPPPLSDFFLPEGAVVPPVTLVFADGECRQDFRVDFVQRSLLRFDSPSCGQTTRLNGWTVTFGIVDCPTPSPMPTLSPTPLPSQTPLPNPTLSPGASCSGDCDGDGVVSIAELIRGVGIALGETALAVCPAFDRDGSGTVSISELIAAVGNALTGCA
jgi:hypothetical protein